MLPSPEREEFQYKVIKVAFAFPLLPITLSLASSAAFWAGGNLFVQEMKKVFSGIY